MRRHAILATLALASVLAGCAGSGPSPSSAPASTAPPARPTSAATESPAPPTARPSVVVAPSPVASGPWVRHTSERFGFSLELPPGWNYYGKATEDWPPNVYPTALSKFTDKFDRPPEAFPGIDISTRPLAAGETQEAFLTWLDGENAKICTIEETEEIVVDGANGRLQRQTCGYNAWEVAVVDDGRVYLVYWLGSNAPIEEERATFQRIMSTFRFAP